MKLVELGSKISSGIWFKVSGYALVPSLQALFHISVTKFFDFSNENAELFVSVVFHTALVYVGLNRYLHSNKPSSLSCLLGHETRTHRTDSDGGVLLPQAPSVCGLRRSPKTRAEAVSDC